ncbi:hypothetical protein LTR53_013806, partial [Teratosphaeriaceae sp. CCFEE 6253]
MDFAMCLSLRDPSLPRAFAAAPPGLFYEAFLQSLSDGIRDFTAHRRREGGRGS